MHAIQGLWLALVYRRAIDLMEAELGDELVALDPEGGECFGFNSVAACVWRLLETPKTFESLHTSLVDEYDVAAEECAADLKQLLTEMTAKGLIAAE